MKDSESKEIAKNQNEKAQSSEQKAKDLKEIIAEFAQKNKTIFLVCLAFSIGMYHGMFDWSTNFGARVKSSSETLFVIQIFLTAFALSRFLVFINIIDKILRMPIICDLIFFASHEERNRIKLWKYLLRLAEEKGRKSFLDKKEKDQEKFRSHFDLMVNNDYFKKMTSWYIKENPSEWYRRMKDNKPYQWGNLWVDFIGQRHKDWILGRLLYCPLEKDIQDQITEDIKFLSVDIEYFFDDKKYLLPSLYRHAIHRTKGYFHWLGICDWCSTKWKIRKSPIIITEQLFFSYVNKHFL